MWYQVPRLTRDILLYLNEIQISKNSSLNKITLEQLQLNIIKNLKQTFFFSFFNCRCIETNQNSAHTCYSIVLDWLIKDAPCRNPANLKRQIAASSKIEKSNLKVFNINVSLYAARNSFANHHLILLPIKKSH